MKLFLLICMLIWTHFAFGQKIYSFSLSGSINLDSGNIQLLAVDNNNDYPDSLIYMPVPVKSGNFHFEGKLPQPVKLRILARLGSNNIYVSEGFYLDSGRQHILCKVDTSNNERETPKIDNQAMQEYLQNFWSLERLHIDTISDYYARKKEIKKYISKYAKKHPDSYVSLWEIAENLVQGYDTSINAAFEGLTPKIKISFSGKQVASDLNHLGLTSIGKTFPTVTTIDVLGKNQKISYSSLKSKYVLLDFWFSHCGPCIGQFPDYVKLVNEYRNKGFTLIGISSDTSHADIAAWKEVIHSQALNWVQYRTDDATMKNLRITRAPSNFLLDGFGTIIAKDLWPNELADFLRDKL